MLGAMCCGAEAMWFFRASCLMGVPRYANGKLCEVMVGLISERAKQTKKERERERGIGSRQCRERKNHHHLLATCGANRLKNIYCCRVAELHSCRVAIGNCMRGHPHRGRAEKDVPRQITDKGTNCSIAHDAQDDEDRTGPQARLA